MVQLSLIQKYFKESMQHLTRRDDAPLSEFMSS